MEPWTAVGTGGEGGREVGSDAGVRYAEGGRSLSMLGSGERRQPGDRRLLRGDDRRTLVGAHLAHEPCV